MGSAVCASDKSSMLIAIPRTDRPLTYNSDSNTKQSKCIISKSQMPQIRKKAMHNKYNTQLTREQEGMYINKHSQLVNMASP